MGTKPDRHRKASGDVIDLYDYVRPLRARPRGWPAPSKCGNPKIITDWPDRIPITEAELDIVEAHFGELLDELFGPR